MKKLFTSSALWSCLFALAMMMTSQSAWAEYVKLTALSGSKSLSDGEGCAKLVDAVSTTKWGQSFDPSNPDRANAWVVVKAEKAVVPDWYFLLTGNDTGGDPGRNWKSWNIYGGNFASDAEAVRGSLEDPAAGGWTLIDERNGEALPQANFASQNFQFNEADGTTAYQYFWIEVLESIKGADTYLQMSEWGLGTYGEFEKYLDDLANVQTGTDEPIVYTIISGDRNDGSGEGLAKLFDGDISTKWGNGLTAKNYGETTNGAHFIIKTSRKMAPTYYKLVTGNDNASWKHRNWNTWQIYGIANADVPADGKPTRNSDKWVLLDKKDNISEDVLPDKNMFTVMFDLSEDVAEEYQYFKVEIDRTMAGSGYMQMGEFSLGDQYTLAIDRNAIVEAAEATYSPDIFAEKALVDQLGQAIEDTKVCTDPFALGNLNATIDDLTSKVATSESQYAELITARNQAINLIGEDNLKPAALAYAESWISETDAIAPSDDYPVGNFGYIKANRQITGPEAVAEAKRITEYLVANVKVEDAPIYATYETIVDANGFNDGEMGHSLIDGDRENTKWCASTDHKPWRLIFKSEDPIKPTYYGLVTGGDTNSYPDRNWKSWKIWAANFDSDEEAKNEESDKWVLIDEKNNVGTDILKTTNKYESYINLSIGCAKPYQYFKIVVEASGGNLIQMNEFTFYNQGNLKEYREGFLTEFDTPETIKDSYVAYKGYIDAYEAAYNVLLGAANPPDVMKAYNELKEALENLDESAALYEEYQLVYEDVMGLIIDSESLSAWQAGYGSENEGPGSKYLRGTYEYITTNLALDNEGIKAETAYLNNIYVACTEDMYILLGGHTSGEWGDGFYGHLININKNGEKEAGSDNGEVKWGGEADANGDTYIIFRTLDKTNPFFYTLTTGNDTQTYTGRNWGTWYIYGANFEGDGDATKDAEGWVLIDSKENVGQDRLHPVNNQPSYFGFSTETTEEYIYYKVVVTKAYSGSAIQMNELHFGTPDEFEAIKDQYQDAAKEFDTNIVAEKALLDDYEASVDAIDECVNMEALFRANYKLETLREEITVSAKAYEKYMNAVAAANDYLDANPLADSEALTIFKDYLNEDVEPNEVFPYGSSQWIIDEHVLADSVVIDEIEFLESLKAAAVAAGYGPGMDVSSLIVNRTFKKAGEMLKDDEGKEIGREAEGWDGYIYRTATDDPDNDIYAAELCVGNAKFDVSQTLTGLKNGYYKVTLNAGYRPNGDVRSFNHAAMAYANDMKTYVPVVRECMAEDSLDSWQGDHYDRPIYALDYPDYEPTGDPTIDSVKVGYVIWGCEGAAHAFAQGRYAITMVAKVTDGKLTIGVKNEGTKGNEWTGIGNFGLVFIGETESNDNSGIAAAIREAVGYNEERISTIEEFYNPIWEDMKEGEVYSDAPNFASAQRQALAENKNLLTYDALKTVGETMQAIYETKKAYAALFEATDKVYAKWLEYANNGDAEVSVYEIRDYLDSGYYDDAEAALATKAKLYETYPDYLEVKGDKGTNIDFGRDGFELDITTTGKNPSLELTGLYEALQKGKAILTFEYTADQDVNGGYFYYETPNLLTDIKTELPALTTAADWTTVSVDLSEGVKEYGFGSATDHTLYWIISPEASKEVSLHLAVRNFRIVAEEAIEGDLNGDDKVDIADAVAVLEVMARDGNDPEADLNGDGKVDIADFVAVLEIMAKQ